MTPKPEYVIDHYQRELADRATRRALGRVGLALLALLAVLFVGAVIGVWT